MLAIFFTHSRRHIFDDKKLSVMFQCVSYSGFDHCLFHFMTLICLRVDHIQFKFRKTRTLYFYNTFCRGIQHICGFKYKSLSLPHLLFGAGDDLLLVVGIKVHKIIRVSRHPH